MVQSMQWITELFDYWISIDREDQVRSFILKNNANKRIPVNTMYTLKHIDSTWMAS